ncbi:hypothetical protein K458DRAFT_389094 [Lentithecium fluviatile CBS 122367]|uniref:Uncharacterized protein n=1 Tax=Lentithecium fluviatile CBS 122367 TaxID=1168545 RepID=A0A6G1J338_9PLEO|nr:hypothetical protein K458DRAFT_389094 [Lentithecium fluviatile CBS 122367]
MRDRFSQWAGRNSQHNPTEKELKPIYPPTLQEYRQAEYMQVHNTIGELGKTSSPLTVHTVIHPKSKKDQQGSTGGKKACLWILTVLALVFALGALALTVRAFFKAYAVERDLAALGRNMARTPSQSNTPTMTPSNASNIMTSTSQESTSKTQFASSHTEGSIKSPPPATSLSPTPQLQQQYFCIHCQ